MMLKKRTKVFAVILIVDSVNLGGLNNMLRDKIKKIAKKYDYDFG